MLQTLMKLITLEKDDINPESKGAKSWIWFDKGELKISARVLVVGGPFIVLAMFFSLPAAVGVFTMDNPHWVNYLAISYLGFLFVGIPAIAVYNRLVRRIRKGKSVNESKNKYIFFLLVLSFLFSFSAIAIAVPGAETAPSIETSKTIDELIDEKIDLEKALDLHTQKIEILNENNRVLEEEINRQQTLQEDLEKKIRVGEERLRVLKKQYDNLLTQQYKQENSDIAFLKALLNSDSFLEAWETWEYYKHISASQQKLIKEYRIQQAELKKEKNQLMLLKDNLSLLHERNLQEKNNIQDEIVKTNELLESNEKQIRILREQSRIAQLELLQRITASLETSASIDQARKQVVETALQQLGKPYVWAATGPNSFDCSGLVVYSYKSIDINLPHYSRAQYQMTYRIEKNQLKPGDLVFIGDSPSSIHHVMIYIGDEYTIEAPRTGDVVKIRPLSARSESDIAGYTTVFINDLVNNGESLVDDKKTPGD